MLVCLVFLTIREEESHAPRKREINNFSLVACFGKDVFNLRGQATSCRHCLVAGSKSSPIGHNFTVALPSMHV